MWLFISGSINKWWCCEMFLDHSRGKKGLQWTARVKDWIEQIDSPSGLGAQPPVTPLQLQQEINQFHPFTSRRSPGWWSILWESRENRSYLELRLSGHLFLSITCQTLKSLSHLAETLAITRLCHISSREQSNVNSRRYIAFVAIFTKSLIETSCLDSGRQWFDLLKNNIKTCSCDVLGLVKIIGFETRFPN